MSIRRGVTDNDRQIAARITAIRRSKGITRAMIARALGVSQQQYQKYENCVNRISASRLSKIAECIGVTVSDIISQNHTDEERIQGMFQVEGAIEMMRLFGELTPEQRPDVIELCRAAARLTHNRAAS